MRGGVHAFRGEVRARACLANRHNVTSRAKQCHFHRLNLQRCSKAFHLACSSLLLTPVTTRQTLVLASDIA